MPRSMLLLPLLMLGSCAERPLALSLPANGEVITYETSPGPFCGNCLSTKIVVSSDGRVAVEQGHWEGIYTDWRVSRWSARLSADKVLPFRERLALYRPSEDQSLGDAYNCTEFWTDSAEVRITWQSESGTSRLLYNYGCDATIRHAMAEALRTAPTLLPLRYLKVPFSQPVATTQTK